MFYHSPTLVFLPYVNLRAVHFIECKTEATVPTVILDVFPDRGGTLGETLYYNTPSVVYYADVGRN